MLMDMFAKAAKPLNSQRFHFHEFMVNAQNEVQAARGRTCGPNLQRCG